MVARKSTVTVVKHGAVVRGVYITMCVSSSVLVILSVTSNKWITTRERLDLKTNYVLDGGSGGGTIDCPEGTCIGAANSSVAPPIEMNISATIGLWKICYMSQELSDVACDDIDYKKQGWGHGEEDAITIYIARGVRRSAFTALLGVATLVVAAVTGMASLLRCNQHLGVLATALTITAAMFQFATMIIFLGGVQSEAALAPPVKHNGEIHAFMYWYGWSFHILIASYLIANLTAVLGIDINIRWYKRVGQQVKAVESETEGDLIVFNETTLSEVSGRYESVV